ncbi:MAG: DUF4197 domain-containing protein [Paludibacter sp.]|nr:DUF4197 domain-containing protein [Paludibacter sp.]
MKQKLFFIIVAVAMSSCAELQKVAQNVDWEKIASAAGGVSNSENILGLKSSLNVGIENAVGILGKQDGFLKDAALKLLLPEEANKIIDNIKLIPGGQALVDKAILSLNRSAEDAVKEAVPIFRNAITGMSIGDATNILFGADNAATEYLKKTTYTQLAQAFAPKIATSLGKDLIGGVSTNKAWNDLTSAYNKAAATTAGKIAGLAPVNVNLEQYVTEKTLNALFTKVANEEKAIRTDPKARVNELLQKVFGQLDKK